VVITDSRHAVPMEKPREFNEALAAFLAPLASGAAGGRLVQAAQ
jgi:hypothetical protein